MLVTLAAYTASDGTARRIAVLIFGPSLAVSRPVPAIVAARLAEHPALVLDRPRGTDTDGDARVVAELAAGEGLAAAQAVIDDYLPRARRATGPLGRPLAPEDLLGPAELTVQPPAGAEGTPWAA